MDILNTFVAFILRRQSVDDVMSQFRKTVDRLETLQDAKQAEAVKLQDQASKIQAKAQVATSEADRACCVASNIRRLVG
jgi:prefoldin subunit 5